MPPDRCVTQRLPNPNVQRQREDVCILYEFSQRLRIKSAGEVLGRLYHTIGGRTV